MDDSQLAAKKVALEQLGYTVTATGLRRGRRRRSSKDSPAPGGSKVGDVITAIDGQPVRLARRGRARSCGRSRSGTTFVFTVTRKDQTRSETITTVEATSGRAARASRQVGIVPLTKDLKLDFPVDVTIDPGPVSGPSAGLAFTLTIIDELTPGQPDRREEGGGDRDDGPRRQRRRGRWRPAEDRRGARRRGEALHRAQRPRCAQAKARAGSDATVDRRRARSTMRCARCASTVAPRCRKIAPAAGGVIVPVIRRP